MRKAGKVLLVILAVLAISAVVGWIVGPEAGGTAMIMISVGLGAYFAVGWGGDYATKIEGYRQELISKKDLPTANRNLRLRTRATRTGAQPLSFLVNRNILPTRRASLRSGFPFGYSISTGCGRPIRTDELGWKHSRRPLPAETLRPPARTRTPWL